MPTQKATTSGPEPIEHAVILAAGVNGRIQEYLPDRPKGFLSVGGEVLIERSLNQLLGVGIKQIAIVTGYHAEYYCALTKRYPNICIYYNPYFEQSGSMYSLYCARNFTKQPFLLLESDLIYHHSALDCLLSSSRPHAVLVSGLTRAGDEVFVEGNNGRIEKMGKDRHRLTNVVGELVGISKISPALFSAMISCAEDYFLEKDFKMDYEDCFNGVASKIELFYLKSKDLIWGEIDDERHLRRVEQEVYPKLLELENPTPTLHVQVEMR